MTINNSNANALYIQLENHKVAHIKYMVIYNTLQSDFLHTERQIPYLHSAFAHTTKYC